MEAQFFERNEGKLHRISDSEEKFEWFVEIDHVHKIKSGEAIKIANEFFYFCDQWDRTSVKKERVESVPSTISLK